MICMIVINVMYPAKEREHEEVQKKNGSVQQQN